MPLLRPPRFVPALSARTWVVLAAAILLAGCQSFKAPPAPKYPDAVGPEDVVLGDTALAAAGKARFATLLDPFPVLTPETGGIVVELDRQLMYVYHEGQLAAVSKIASGRRNHRTETGRFTVGQKSKNHRSNIYGDFVDPAGAIVASDVDVRVDAVPDGAVYRGSSMANFLRLFHQGKSTPIGFHAGSLPGYPASHGCLRLPRGGSAFLFERVPIGFPVVIRGEKYGVPFGTKQRGTQRAPKTAAPSVERAPSAEAAPSPDPSVPTSPAPAAAPSADNAPSEEQSPTEPTSPTPTPPPLPLAPSAPAETFPASSVPPGATRSSSGF